MKVEKVERLYILIYTEIYILIIYIYILIYTESRKNIYNDYIYSKAAGNTGVRNELASVCDELLRQNLIDKHKYKIIILQS